MAIGRVRPSRHAVSQQSMYTSSTSHPPRLTPRTFVLPYAKLGLMGLSARTVVDNSAASRETTGASRLREGMVRRPGGEDKEEMNEDRAYIGRDEAGMCSIN